MAKALRAAAKRTIQKQFERLQESIANNEGIEELSVRKQLIADAWNDYRAKHAEVISGIEDDTRIPSENYECDAAEELYIKASAKVSILIAAKQKPFAPPATQGTSMGPVRVEVVQSALQKLQVPRFDGNYAEWTKFSNTFKALVHDVDSMQTMEKFHRLINALQGEPSNLVNRYEMTPENYPLAWDALKERYDNTKKIVDAHLTRLFNQQQVQRGDMSALRTLIDTTNMIVQSLHELRIPVEHWDAIFVHIVMKRIDQSIKHDWELTRLDKPKGEIPKWKDLAKFLERRAAHGEILTDYERETRFTQSSNQSTSQGRWSDQGAVGGEQRSKQQARQQFPRCMLCNGDHPLYKCRELRDMPMKDRWARLSKFELCNNCFRRDHKTKDCAKPGCPKCNGQKHNSTLCPNANHNNKSEKYAMAIAQEPTTTRDASIEKQTHLALDKAQVQQASSSQQSEMTLLATACVLLKTSNGSFINARALCDAGSQINLITVECMRRLGLKMTTMRIPITGVGKTAVQANGEIVCCIASRLNDYQREIHATVLPKITSVIPPQQFERKWPELYDLELADPQFGEPRHIDMLLGAALWAEIIGGEIRRGNSGQPTLQASKLGWLAFGSCHGAAANASCNLAYSEENYENIEQLLQRLWEVHEPAQAGKKTPEEIFAENHFMSTHRRTSDGRYVVRYPFIDSTSNLRGTRKICEQRFRSLSAKFARYPKFHANYRAFINEFIALGHMHEVIEDKRHPEEVILPHHGIDKGKFRVVFDGSCKCESGKSLNDFMQDGPTQQDDLIDIQLRFRAHRIAITADIVKMFRQVMVDPHDAVAQRILWCFTPGGPLITLQHDRIVYGLKAASYLAIASLRQCAIDHADEHALAAKIALRDFWVDDLITGADTEECAIEIFNELTALLEKGKFPLAKWTSNSWRVLEAINEKTTTTIRPLSDAETTPVLGMHWNTLDDVFVWKVQRTEHTSITKRMVVSQVAKLYDPNGLLGPIVIRAKIIVQDIWKEGTEWDHQVSAEIEERYKELMQELPLIETVKVPRWISTTATAQSIQFFGFADASNSAYGAAIYIKVIRDDNTAQTILLFAKSKAAPVKAVTTPRLELCAAELLGRNIEHVQRVMTQVIEAPVKTTICWSDSMVVLHWLRKLPCQLKTYVANRVNSVQTTTKGAKWRHVPTADNPADVISRGTTVEQLIDSRLWWAGPEWLASGEEKLPQKPAEIEDDEAVEVRREERVPEVLLVTTSEIRHLMRGETHLLECYASWRTTVRVTMYALRFIRNCREHKRTRPKTNSISHDEVAEQLSAEAFIIAQVQAQYYPVEIQELQRGHRVPARSKLLQMNPRIDDEGVLRMCSRTIRSNAPSDTREPIIVPPKSRAALLIIREAHQKTLHAGVQGTMQFIRQRYWIPRLRQVTRAQLRKCIFCHRYQAQPNGQMMAALPKCRVTPTFPFAHTGIDYAGPIRLRAWNNSRKIELKGYIAVFVCMATRAVHLEAVTNLTTDAFMAAYYRLASRRGSVECFHSDNATNFVGASKEMAAIWSSWTSAELVKALAKESVQWEFIPPGAPHQGGLWEAAVKSCKYHLRRLTHGHALTFEQLATLLSQIEAILNARPLHPVSDDPSDLEVITPAHLINGRPLTAPLMRKEAVKDVSPTKRWAFIQAQVRIFWDAWRADYLVSLQRRAKWTTPCENVKIGDLVLILEDNVPPPLWALGRVTKARPDAQGLVRSITIRTAYGHVQRPIQKVSVLPLDSDSQ